MDTPKTLFRYFWNPEEVRTLLTDNQLRFASPNSFNDPFDCKTLFMYQNATKEEVRHWLFLIVQYSSPDLNHIQIATKVDEYLANNWPLSDSQIMDEEGIWEESIAKTNDDFSICCFSETKMDILMWAHYANGHKGYCLEFDVGGLKREAQLDLHKVGYRQDYPHLRDLLQCFPNVHQLVVLSKSIHWEYEMEWRAVVKKPAQSKNHIQVKIPSSACTGVIFGCNCPEAEIEVVKTLVKESGKPIKLYRAVKSKNTYTLDILGMGEL